MAEPLNPHSFDAPSDRPLIGIPLEENGREFVRYFTDEAEADKAMASHRHKDVRHLAGAWKRADPNLGWDEVADELDRIRHESKPTPPIDLDI